MVRVAPLELRRITIHFGRQSVLRGLDVVVRPGEVVGLLGANGSGKTTLLAIAAGLVQPTAGERWLGGMFSPEVGLDQRARMAWLGHTPQLYPLLTAKENLELFVSLRRAVPALSLSVDQLLSRLGLMSAADRPVRGFSRGMMQRLALARALSSSPDVLLLDEPFTALDRAGRALLVDVLREERARGAAVMFASHDTEAVVAAADRALLLEEGRIVGEVTRTADGDVWRPGVLRLLDELGSPREAAGIDSARARQEVGESPGRT